MLSEPAKRGQAGNSRGSSRRSPPEKTMVAHGRDRAGQSAAGGAPILSTCPPSSEMKRTTHRAWPWHRAMLPSCLAIAHATFAADLDFQNRLAARIVFDDGDSPE